MDDSSAPRAAIPEDVQRSPLWEPQEGRMASGAQGCGRAEAAWP